MKICSQCKAVLGQSAESCTDDDAAPTEVSTLPPGATLGAYRIVGELGDGGMGVVYEAVHEVLGRRSALKLLRPEFAKNEEVVTRFLQEAKAVNLINNKHIVNVYDYGDDIEGLVYFVMEYLEGKTLADVMDEHAPMPSELFCHVFLQVLQGLAAAHESRIVHRDLKFENIYAISKEGNPLFVKLLDFGIAKLRGEHSVEGLTQAGRLIGTPRFMSPEQFRGKEVDARSDVFSLGIMMYAAATGHMPFADGDLSDLATGIIKEQQVPAAERHSGVSQEISDLIDKALAKDAADRFPNARSMQRRILEIRDALDPDSSKITACLRTLVGDPNADVGRAVLTPPPPADEPRHAREVETSSPASSGPRRGLVLGLGASTLAVAAGLVLLIRGGGDSKKDSSAAKPVSEAPARAPESPLAAALREGSPKLGELAKAKMRALWDDSRPSQRRALVEALAQVGGREAAPFLIEALAEEPTTALRAAQALGEYGDAEVKDAIAKALPSASVQIRFALATALERHGDERGRSAMSALLSEPRHRASAALALSVGSAAPRVANVLRDVFAETPPWKGRWLGAAEALAAAGDADAKAALVGALTSDSEERQFLAAEALARGKHEEGLAFLSDVVADARSKQRGAAALLLAQHAHADAQLFVPVGLMGDATDGKIVAIAVLSRLGGEAREKQAGRVAEAAESQEPKLSMAALAALSNMTGAAGRDE